VSIDSPPLTDTKQRAPVRPTHSGSSPVTPVLASEGGYQTFTLSGGEWLILIASALTALLAIGVGFFLMKGVLAEDAGTPKMQEIAKAIQEGATCAGSSRPSPSSSCRSPSSCS
jgi:hypothetical protein